MKKKNQPKTIFQIKYNSDDLFECFPVRFIMIFHCTYIFVFVSVNEIRFDLRSFTLWAISVRTMSTPFGFINNKKYAECNVANACLCVPFRLKWLCYSMHHLRKHIARYLIRYLCYFGSPDECLRNTCCLLYTNEAEISNNFRGKWEKYSAFGSIIHAQFAVAMKVNAIVTDDTHLNDWNVCCVLTTYIWSVLSQ